MKSIGLVVSLVFVSACGGGDDGAGADAAPPEMHMETASVFKNEKVDLAVTPPDGSGVVEYSWQVLSSPMDSTVQLYPVDNTAQMRCDRKGEVQVVAETTVDGVSVAQTQFAITVINRAPVARIDVGFAATDMQIAVSGATSNDPDRDALSYSWSVTAQPTGATAAFDQPTAEEPKLTVSMGGSYELQLTVDDGDGESATTTAMIDAYGRAFPPVVSTGSFSYPQYSPQREEIYFSGTPNLRAIHVPTGELRELANSGAGSLIDVSPNGERVSFSRNPLAVAIYDLPSATVVAEHSASTYSGTGVMANDVAYWVYNTTAGSRVYMLDANGNIGSTPSVAKYISLPVVSETLGAVLVPIRAGSTSSIESYTYYDLNVPPSATGTGTPTVDWKKRTTPFADGVRFGTTSGKVVELESTGPALVHSFPTPVDCYADNGALGSVATLRLADLHVWSDSTFQHQAYFDLSDWFGISTVGRYVYPYRDGFIVVEAAATTNLRTLYLPLNSP